MKTDLSPSPDRQPSDALAANQVTLPSPLKVKGDLPLSTKARETVDRARREISAILRGEDRERVLVVCGPCSIDDLNAAAVYAEKLSKLAEEVSDKVLLVMRTYFEKPRSVVGWKGMLYDPLGGEDRSASAGILMARRLLMRINEIGLPCATEFLNPLLAMYLEDAIAYGSIGSRTVESQIHREMASGLAMPIGMKNGMDGNAQSALNAVQSASLPHSYFGSNEAGQCSLLETSGNAFAHVILRGGSNGPNYSADSVNTSVEAARDGGLSRPVVVDCSHGNSQKDHTRQVGVAREVLEQLRAGQLGIAGLMLESHLVAGKQSVGDGGTRTFGQSITDACIGWEDTRALVLELADCLRKTE